MCVPRGKFPASATHVSDMAAVVSVEVAGFRHGFNGHLLGLLHY